MANRMIINNVEIDVPNGANVSIVGNKVYVNGQECTPGELQDKAVVNLVIKGNVGNVSSDVDVTCNEIHGTVNCGRDCEVSGSITGNVSAGRDIDCTKINGSASAGRDIN